MIVIFFYGLWALNGLEMMRKLSGLKPVGRFALSAIVALGALACYPFCIRISWVEFQNYLLQPFFLEGYGAFLMLEATAAIAALALAGGAGNRGMVLRRISTAVIGYLPPAHFLLGCFGAMSLWFHRTHFISFGAGAAGLSTALFLWLLGGGYALNKWKPALRSHVEIGIGIWALQFFIAMLAAASAFQAGIPAADSAFAKRPWLALTLVFPFAAGFLYNRYFQTGTPTSALSPSKENP